MSAELRRLADGVLLPGFSGTALPERLRDRLAAGLGGVTLFATNVEDACQVGDLTAAIHEAKPDAVIAIDEEGGDVTRLEWVTGSSYPGNLALGAVDDPALTERVGAAIGADLSRAGIDLNLAPSVDVNCEPDNPVIGVRSFGSDAERVAVHAAAWVRGHESRGVAACAKHFPGHGATTADSHHALPRLEVDRSTLDRRELVPFRAVLAAGVRAVLTAHLVIPALDSAPATVSRSALHDLLRGELGFDGLVVTDALDMAGIAATMGSAQGAVRALRAGADALCLGMDHDDHASTDVIREAIVGALRDGTLDEPRVHEAAARMRSLARWSAQARLPAPHPDHALGLAAARRALRATGVHRLAAPPVVVELPAVPNMAAGDQTPWGIAGYLAALLPGTRTWRAAAGQGLPDPEIRDIVAQAVGRPLVVVVREVHRDPLAARTLRSLLGSCDDVVVIETGFPGPRPTVGGVWVYTHGGSRVSMQAAAELLATGIGAATVWSRTSTG